MGLQSQRIPLGTVTVGGRELPVFITLSWLKVLQALDGTVTNVIDGDGNSPETMIELPYDEAAALKVLAIALQKAVFALEADQSVSALRARVAALEDRIAGMEQAP